MNSGKLHIILADDDRDDHLFFKEAIEELKVMAQLTTVENGEELMKLLNEKTNHACHVLFMDLNMPRKNGFECLKEIKLNAALKHLPVIIFSTSKDEAIVNEGYQKGANYYIRKPITFLQLKSALQKALALVFQDNLLQPAKEQFVITGDLKKLSNERNRSNKISQSIPGSGHWCLCRRA